MGKIARSDVIAVLWRSQLSVTGRRRTIILGGPHTWFEATHSTPGVIPLRRVSDITKCAMASICRWRSRWLVMGGESSWGTSVAAHSSRSLSVFLRESSASVNTNSASSKPARDVKGDQSLFALMVGTSGGASGGMGSPYLSQRCPVEDEN
jgi:hypothetical protein